MGAQTVRTTVDLDKDLVYQWGRLSLDMGVSKKEIVRDALLFYFNNFGKKVRTAGKLWKETRMLAKKGKKNVDLVEALRLERDRL